MSIKYIDLFAGVGGFHYGIDSCRKFRGRTRMPQYIRSNRDSSNSKGESWENNKNYYKNVYSNEYDKYANSVYKYHFGECDNRDIRDVSAEEIPDHDLLCGGFPCQSFSIAGKRRGFEDTRGTLFFEIARILKQKQPRLLLLENVKGLLSHDKGKTFATIISTLDELGYDIQWQVLNSKDFGVPQNRERVFIIGNLRGTSRPEVFPVKGNDTKIDKTEKLSEPISNCLRTNYSNGKSNETYIRQLNHPTHSNDRVYGDDGISPTLNTMQGGNRQPKIITIGNIYPSKHEAGNIYDQNGLSPTIKCNGPRPNSKNISPKIISGAKIRRLTPVECERLQGFPDNWTKYGHDDKEMSDTQRYKMMGNAVSTPVITAIAEKLLM